MSQDDDDWAFWKDLVCNEDGTLNLQKVKGELHDYGVILDQVREVYDHVSGGRISKPNTLAYEVCAAADDHYAKHFAEIHSEQEDEV